MSLDRLRLLAIVLPIAFLICAQLATWIVLEPVLGNTNGHLVAAGILAAGVIAFSIVMFRMLDRMHQKIVRQNEELSPLNAVAWAVSGSLDIQEAASRALRNVMEVTGARGRSSSRRRRRAGSP